MLKGIEAEYVAHIFHMYLGYVSIVTSRENLLEFSEKIHLV